MDGRAERGAAAGALASLAGLIAALSYCMPLAPLLMAAGAVTTGVFLEKLRPALLAVSAVCLIFAFVQTYVRRRCAFRHRRARTVLLWLSTGVLVLILAAPEYLASLIAGRIPALRAASELQPFDTQEFVRRFDEASAHPRMVLLLSPT